MGKEGCILFLPLFRYFIEENIVSFWPPLCLFSPPYPGRESFIMISIYVVVIFVTILAIVVYKM